MRVLLATANKANAFGTVLTHEGLGEIFKSLMDGSSLHCFGEFFESREQIHLAPFVHPRRISHQVKSAELIGEDLYVTLHVMDSTRGKLLSENVDANKKLTFLPRISTEQDNGPVSKLELIAVDVVAM